MFWCGSAIACRSRFGIQSLVEGRENESRQQISNDDTNEAQPKLAEIEVIVSLEYVRRTSKVTENHGVGECSVKIK